MPQKAAARVLMYETTEYGADCRNFCAVNPVVKESVVWGKHPLLTE